MRSTRASAAIARLNRAGFTVAVATNQSGIGRGLFDMATFNAMNDKMMEMVFRQGGRIDALFFCPHTADAQCECRKPKIGMLERGAVEFGIDLRNSFVVGDSVVDMQAGNTARAKKVLVLTGYGATAREQCTSNNIHINHVAPTIVEAIDFILHTLDGETKS